MLIKIPKRLLINSLKEGIAVYVSLYELGLFILFTIAVVVSAYLITVLHQAFCVIGHVRAILNARDADIQETLSVLPETLSNINELAISLKQTASQTNDAFHYLQDDLSDTVDSLRDGLETIVVYGKVIGDVFRAVFSKAA